MVNMKWIRPYQFAKLHDTAVQNVYRWIREGKIPNSKVKKEKMLLERLYIASDAIMNIQKRR